MVQALIVHRSPTMPEVQTVHRILSMPEVQTVPKIPTIQEALMTVSSSSSMLVLETVSGLTLTLVNLTLLIGLILHKGLKGEQQALILSSQISTRDLLAQLRL